MKSGTSTEWQHWLTKLQIFVVDNSLKVIFFLVS